MPSVAFNTPAYKRVEVSRICFAQRRRCLDVLKAAGVEAQAFIVADDANLELADEFGFERVEHKNTELGRKWNAGYQAAKDFDWIMPIGSDSLLDPQLILHWLDLSPNPLRIPFTTAYTVIHRDGDRRIECHVTSGGGGGMMLPAELLRPMQFQPVKRRLNKGCDHSTLINLGRYRQVRLQAADVHPLAVCALHTAQQISSYERLFLRWGVCETDDPFTDLVPVYGRETVKQIKSLYGV